MDAVKDASHLYEVERRASPRGAAGLSHPELQISPTQQVPWHSHSKIQDTFYVLEGRAPDLPARSQGRRRLGPGETYAVRPRRPHLVTNAGTTHDLSRAPGIGEYDYVPLV